MKKYDIYSCIRSFNTERNINARYASYDLCYGYFQTNRSNLDIEKSCLYLWGYLASWGMLRGSSALLQRSPVALKPLIKYFDEIKSDSIWTYDVTDYTKETKHIGEVYDRIEGILKDILESTPPTTTLITKIMLGVFGCVPAFDTYFRKTFRAMYADRTNEPPYSDFANINSNSLDCILNFYMDNRDEIDKFDIHVFNFDGTESDLVYKKAKLIDMYGFTKGLLNDNTLSGKFSVSDFQQVQFSKGNLQYYFDENLFRFANNQYDLADASTYVYNAERFMQEYFNKWVDLFAFGTGNKPFFTGEARELKEFEDWGKYIREDDGTTPWRTLTSDEWEYMFVKRANAQNLYTRGTVSGVRGIILLPDDWSNAEKCVITADSWNILEATKVNQYTSNDWERLVNLGAVFLPITERSGSLHIDCGAYWSSTTCSMDDCEKLRDKRYKWFAYVCHFTQSMIDPAYCDEISSRKTNRYAVRLVKNCETKEQAEKPLSE